MTLEQEAVDYYNNIVIDTNIGLENICKTSDLINLSIEALEKQIPKKPTQVDKWGEIFQCPKCNGFVTDYFGCRMEYCSRCGQALKWESEE